MVWLGSSITEKDLRVLLVHRLCMSQQCGAVIRKVDTVWGGINRCIICGLRSNIRTWDGVG